MRLPMDAPKPAAARPAMVGISLIPGLLFAGCTTAGGAELDAGAADFDQYEIVIGAARRQTVLTGFLRDGPIAELAVVNNDDRRLRIFANDEGAWKAIVDETLRDEVLFVDVGNIGGRDRLMTYEHGRLNWFDLASKTERPMVEIASDFSASADGRIPHVDITRDMNGDGLDDLVVPGADGFRIFIQTDGGAFADPQVLGPPPAKNKNWTHENNPWLQSLVQLMDCDRDGRGDLVFWNQDHFEVHLMDERSRFAAAARTLTPDVGCDAFGLYFLTIPEREVAQDPGETRRALSSFEDLNGDGAPDLVIVKLKGTNPQNFRTVSAIHFGAPTPGGGIGFALGADVEIESDGVQLGRQQHDLDGDGRVELMLITCNNLGLLKMGLGMLTGSMSLDLEFYRMEGGTYPDSPTVTRRIKGVFNEDAYHQPVLLSDVNGDGRSDLLVQQGPKEFRVFAGEPGPELFSRSYQKVVGAMPDNASDTRLVELNRDGKPDILMHRRFTDCYWNTTDVNEPHRVTLLITR